MPIMEPAMGTHFNKDSKPATGSLKLGEKTCDRDMTDIPSYIDNHALSVSREYDYDYKKSATTVDKKCGSVNESCMLPEVQIELLKYSPAMVTISSNKIEETSTRSDDYLSKVVDVTKLMAQILNAKVVLRKLEEPRAKSSHLYAAATNADLDDEKAGECDETSSNDYAYRYCATCKKTKYARIKDPTVKNCSDCKIAMTYLCIKCNVKHYKRYPFLKFHSDRCNGNGDDIDNTEPDVGDQSGSTLALDKSQFIVKQIQSVKWSEKWTRYCPMCDLVASHTGSYRQRCSCGESLIFKCKKCDGNYNSPQSMVYHLESQCYPTIQYQCTQCTYSTTCWQNMKIHFKFRHTDQPSLKCSLCPYESKWGNSLYIHTRKVHHKIDKKFHCSSCSYSTKFECNLRRHRKLNH